MPTVIAGEGMGGYTRVTSTEPAVQQYLEESQRASYGREARRQGSSNTWWCGRAVVMRVKELRQ